MTSARLVCPVLPVGANPPDSLKRQGVTTRAKNPGERSIAESESSSRASGLRRQTRKPACARSDRSRERLSRRALAAKAGWSSERRARQAALIGRWAPWLSSTGPKTEAGKARCSMNALKHGYRSRATIAEYRRIRRVLRQVDRNIAILRAYIRARDQAARPPIKLKPWYVNRSGSATTNLNATSPLRGGRSAGARRAEADRVGGTSPVHCPPRPPGAIAPP